MHALILALCACKPQGRSPSETARPVSYSRRYVGGVPVIEEHSCGIRFDPSPQQDSPAEDVPLGAAERLASLCHHDAVLDLACLQVRHLLAILILFLFYIFLIIYI